MILLTADRDEKVRLSHFPDAHVVRGYLLGHAAFMSTMDAVAIPSDGDGDGRPTGGGGRVAPPGAGMAWSACGTASRAGRWGWFLWRWAYPPKKPSTTFTS